MDSITLYSTAGYFSLYKILRYYNVNIEICDKILSTINSSSSVILSPYIPLNAVKIFAGYFIYDTGFLFSNRRLFKRTFYPFILHHLLSISMSYVLLTSESARDIILDLYKLEATVPIGNAIWLCRHYNIDDYRTRGLKILFLLMFGYYRVYYFFMVNYKYFKENKHMLLLFFSSSLWTVNFKWFLKIIRIALK